MKRFSIVLVVCMFLSCATAPKVVTESTEQTNRETVVSTTTQTTRTTFTESGAVASSEESTSETITFIDESGAKTQTTTPPEKGKMTTSKIFVISGILFCVIALIILWVMYFRKSSGKK